MEKNEDVLWLIGCLKNFYPFKEMPPENMFPTNYQTLTYEGDLKLKKKFDEIVEKYPSSNKE